MGVNIHCGKHEGMDMSYSTFDLWRVQLAKALNSTFGEEYKKWLYNFRPTKEAIERFETACTITNELTQELFDFFTMSDCEGKISSKTSKQLLPLIEKLQDDYKIGYLGICPYSKDFVMDFFKYSVKHHANVWWD